MGRRGLYLGTAVIFALLPVGCGEDREELTAPPQGEVTVSDVEYTEDGVSFVVQGDRMVSVRRDANGLTAAISDTEMLAEIGIAHDNGSLTIVERTSEDEMSFTISPSETGIREHYVVNGEELTITYPELDDEVMALSVREYHAGNYDAISPELLQALVAFDAFYTPHLNNSLHNNRDGELLARSLVQVAKSREFDGPDLGPSALQLWCGSWGIIGGIKCWFGGPANYACLFARVTGFVCAITMLAGWGS